MTAINIMVILLHAGIYYFFIPHNNDNNNHCQKLPAVEFPNSSKKERPCLHYHRQGPLIIIFTNNTAAYIFESGGISRKSIDEPGRSCAGEAGNCQQPAKTKAANLCGLQPYGNSKLY